MSSSTQLDLATASASDFRPHIGSEFTVAGVPDREELVLELVDVTEYPDHGRESGRKPFGLIFKCSTEVLKQGTYHLHHGELPEFELFLCPFEGGGDWCRLEAIFN